MLSQSSASKRGMARRSDGSGVYKNAGKDQQRGTLWRTPRMCSVRQMGRNQSRRRADRGRRLHGEASPRGIEMVAAEGIHVAVIAARRSQSEGESDRCRARDRSAVRLGEANRVVRIVEAEGDPAACHLTSMAVALFRYGADRKA